MKLKNFLAAGLLASILVLGFQQPISATSSISNVRACRSLVNRQLRNRTSLSGLYRRIASREILFVINRLNEGRFTYASAEIYLYNKIYRFTENKNWSQELAGLSIAAIRQARQNVNCLPSI